ncbi:hypothetical protein ACF1A5_12205 [Streptomyces sp. NPDC014864]|uniref:hypothetical protein n=1 Tax=Streptomyces sp. NPDC014864 TaxID=3364924 RepID=UPI0036FABFE7
MSDLKKEAVSMHKTASGLRRVGQHTAKPLQQFHAQSHDLGALGALLSATGEIREGMTMLAKPAKPGQEWEAEAEPIAEVSEGVDPLDVLIAAAAQAKKG